MDWYALSDPAVMAELGKRIKEIRLRKNVTQKDLAFKAGISLLSLQKLESGHSVTLSTFIRVVRMLRLLENFDTLVPESTISPVLLLKLKGRERHRAGKPSKK